MLCDLTALETLPRHDYVAGLAEVVKVGFTHDPRILELVEQDPKAAHVPDGPHTRELVERAIAVKAAVVADDLTEQGEREFLNYGHTLGARDREGRGLPLAARRGGQRRPGLRRRARPARRAGSTTRPPTGTARVLESVGLPTSYAGDWQQVHAAMRVDKKSRGEPAALRRARRAGAARACSRTPTRRCSSRRTRRSARTAAPEVYL